MNPTRLASLAELGRAFDWETHRVQPGLLAPPPVCAAVALRRPDGTVGGHLLGRDDGQAALEALLAEPRIVVVGQNIAFDLLVGAVHAARRGVDLMPAIFAAFQTERVFDVGIAEALHAVAEGTLLKDPRTGRDLQDPEDEGHGKKVGYRLSVLVDLVLGRADAKANDEYRESYALLEDVPIAEWPWHARQYPVDDACNTLEVALAQVGAIPCVSPHRWAGAGCSRCGQPRDARTDPRCVATYPRRNLHDHAIQVYAAWCLHLGAAWGFRTDPVATEILAGCVAREREAGTPEFLELGLLRMKREKGAERAAKDMTAIRRRVALAYGCSGTCETCGGRGRVGVETYKADPTREKKGSGRACPACGGTALDLKSAPVPMSDASDSKPDGQVGTGRDVLFESGDDALTDFAEYQQDDKILDTYVPALRDGASQPWTLRPNAILATGRVSYSGKAQTLPRNLSARLTEALRREASRLAAEGRAEIYVPRGVRDCIVPRTAPRIVVDVPDDYVLQDGEEFIP